MLLRYADDEVKCLSNQREKSTSILLKGLKVSGLRMESFGQVRKIKYKKMMNLPLLTVAIEMILTHSS